MSDLDFIPQAYTVRQFCRAYNISRTKLHDLWNEGRGPRSYHLGRRRYISRASAHEWQCSLEEHKAERAGQ